MKKLFLLCAFLSAPVYGMGDFDDGEIVLEMWMFLMQEDTDVERGNAGNLFYAAQKGQNEEVVQLLQQKISPDVRDVHGRTALMLAAGSNESGTLESIRVLLQYNAGINARDNHNQTALHKASQEGHAEKIALLFAHGASIGMVDREGSKPINCAHAHGIEIWGLLRSAEVPHTLASLLRLFS